MWKFKLQSITNYLKSLRDQIIARFESLEQGKKFKRTLWDYPSGGGGEISLLRGDVFEKAAVNWSGVKGEKLPLSDGEGKFFATGVSLITHMKNPKMPTVHMNIRFIKTEAHSWFGGGYDLTPMGFACAKETAHFHTVAKNSLDPHGLDLYPRFSKNAREYFLIKHWKVERGVGGIFFDHYETSNFEKDLAMWKSVGDRFLDAIMPIYRKKKELPFSKEDKRVQNLMRARYVEFNLLYDRGTKFGFASNGNPEAILSSMPPTASW